MLVIAGGRKRIHKMQEGITGVLSGQVPLINRYCGKAVVIMISCGEVRYGVNATSFPRINELSVGDEIFLESTGRFYPSIFIEPQLKFR